MNAARQSTMFSGRGSGGSRGAQRSRGGERGRFGQALATTVTFLAILWIVQAINALSGYRLTAFGIRPREVDGLIGIVTAPFIHGSWSHLIANSTLAAVLLFMVALSGRRVVWLSSIVIVLIAGVGTWLTGQPYSVHIGASGLIFGWLTFLMTRGLFTKRFVQLLVGVVLLLAYGGVLWGVLPGTPGVSWQGHMFGAIGGVVAAWLLGRSGSKPAAGSVGPAGPRLGAGM